MVWQAGEITEVFFGAASVRGIRAQEGEAWGKSDKEEGGEGVIIAVGDLKGVRRKRRKDVPRCRKNNRKIHTMPSHQVKSQLKYKAEWEGIPVVFVNEAWTSQRCWRCGERGRRNKRRFVCPSCGSDYNADLNGARNILNRLLGYMLGSRAAVSEPAPNLHGGGDEGDVKAMAVCDGGSPPS